MSKARTLARPYARAIFEHAHAAKQLEKWSTMLNFAAELSEHPDIKRLMKNPKFSQQQIIDLFVSLGKEEIDTDGKRFLEVLSTFKRLELLPEIAGLFEDLRKQVESIVSVELVSARPVAENIQQQFSAVLQQRMSCQIALNCVVDASLIGGAIVKAGDLVIDGSVRGRLEKLSDAIGLSY